MLNIRNLVQNDRVDPEMFAAFSRLFDSVGVDSSELMTVIERLGDADRLSPLSDRELSWVGLSEDSLKKLKGLVTWLPSVTPVNVNTAPSLVLSALFPGLQPGQVSEIVLQRTREAWQSLDDFSTKVGPAVSQISSGKISFRSDYFRVIGRISTGNSFQTEEALMRRDGNVVEILWLRHDANK
jgi:general secretion pathway protein K